MVNVKASVLIGLMLVSPAHGVAQVTGPQTPAGCIRAVFGERDPQAMLTVSGRLTLQLFPGPPNYESIAAGDVEERTFIVELPQAICIDDNGEFADSSERFVTVQISSSQEALMGVLRASVGRQVTVSGEGFASHTGHHHAPLVVLVDRVSVE